MLSAREIYVSTDVEADGPIPGTYSMLSLGSAAYDWRGKLLGTFYRKLEPLPGASQDEGTMQWWSELPEAWAEATSDSEPPEKVMKDYVLWLEDLPGQPVFVAYPAGFDWSMVYWYLMHFVGSSPFSFSSLDIKTLAMARLAKGFHSVSKSNMPLQWFEGAEPDLAHRAIDDALSQGTLFFNLVKDLSD
jgi:hypothetical protein